jgi:hypothetical protein
MKHSIIVIFGKEQVDKFYQNEPFTDAERENHIKTYHFSSIKELDAFSFGINEAIGWLECHVLRTEQKEEFQTKNLNSCLPSISK